LTIQNLKKKKSIHHLRIRKRIRPLNDSAIIKTLSAKKADGLTEEIRALKQQMEFILGATKTGLDIIDSDFNIRYIDPEWAKVYGNPTGKKCFEYFMDRREVCPHCGISTASKTKDVTVTEEILVKEGNRPIQVTTIPFQNEKREWLFAEVNVDISDRKRAEEALRKAHQDLEMRVQERTAQLVRTKEAMEFEIAESKRAEDALRESEKRFRELYDNAPVGYHEYNLEGQITKVNQTDLEMLGYTAEEMIGRPIWTFNVGEEIAREQVLAKLAGTLPPGRNLERTYRRKDGTTFPVLIEDRLILDEKGHIQGIRCTIQDITERKRAEKELSNLQEQLRQSQKIEAIGQLAGGVAHDFNNLLTVIKGYAQLSLLDLKENNPVRENIQEIQKATQRATDLTRQLLAFSRRQILDPKVLDLNSLLRDTEKMLRRMIGEDIELITLLSEDLGRVKIDPSQIEQVIFNLAVNARDAMPSGGKLTIETANVTSDEHYAHTHIGMPPGHYVRLSVSDTGVGMSREVQEKAFDPFFTTKDKGKGTGLGLSTVHGIVTQSGGKVLVYSEPGHGTTFKIYFPTIEGELDAPNGKNETESLPRGSETVLLVEDEPSVRDLAKRLLKQQGYRVLEAANGEEALRLVQEKTGEKIHLLLTDVVLPQMGGKELADQLRILRPGIKVLYTSGYTDYAIVHHGVLDSGTDFLQKPFSLKTLSQKVREVLDW
jgi:two-component system cell cycle sensor histidine kinase/response regulator CckA